MQPRGGGGKWWLIIFLIIALIISVFFNFGQLASVAQGVGAKQTTLVAGDSQNKVAVVPVDGMILDSSQQQFDQLLGEIEKDSTVKSLVVEIDTPGGSASASDEMYHRLLKFKQDEKDSGHTIPVVISMRGMATSGGYYLSCAGDYIFAEPICLTGNIGVLLPRVNLSKLVGDHGIEETTLTATTTGHSFKNAGSMFKPPVPEDEAYLQGIVDGLFAQFKDAVQAGRKGKLNDTAGDIFSGKAFIAADAKDRGLIDQIDYPDKAYAYAAQQAGVSNASVVLFTPRVSIFDWLGSSWQLGPVKSASSQGTVSVNGINVDARSLQDLISARPLMLWRGN